MNRITTKEIDRLTELLKRGCPVAINYDELLTVLAELKELRTLCEKQSRIITSQSLYIADYIDGRN